MEALFQVLHSFNPMSEELQQHLSRVLKYKFIPRKQFLLREGEVARQIGFIQSGLLRCYSIKDGIEVSRWFMNEGNVITSVQSFFKQKPSREFIEAIEDCTLFYVTAEELEDTYLRYPEFERTGRLLTQRYYVLWDQRLEGITMQSAMERYVWLLENHPELALRVPAKYIASWLDITAETLSKMKAQLQSSRH